MTEGTTRQIKDRTLVVEGGGFKCAFTAGILDAFHMTNYRPFDRYVAVSGGAVAVSYFLSRQYRSSIKSLLHLANHEEFATYARMFSSQGYMDLNILTAVAREKIVFDLLAAMKEVLRFPVHFVATDEVTGEAAYLEPGRHDWLDAIVASASLPFFTKGGHLFRERSYIDGGCSDPLPVRWAYEQGARDVLVIRTWPSAMRFTRSWAEVFGSYYFRDNPILKRIVDESHAIYNAGADFIDNPPDDLRIQQLAPEELLETGTYRYSPRGILNDYGQGLDTGLRYVHQMREMETIGL